MKYRLKAIDTTGQVAWARKKPSGNIEWIRDESQASVFEPRETSELIRKLARSLGDWTFHRVVIE